MCKNKTFKKNRYVVFFASSAPLEMQISISYMGYKLEPELSEPKLPHVPPPTPGARSTRGSPDSRV
jgi:hypothetical protein